ncbi:hypothetical protein V0R50_13080 [Pseudomonas sp. 148P]|uniref:Uncharacterized protein n=1 Tax=Pseudomonas ulcerans TaxID=3115852 RepID=A0ABU7HRJ6_9PSED|nr:MULTISPECIES: hypothetical protein [unclassified Pseudomonas]MEE1923198.1 hypothetical protein [Pseudomonas sp. 147P]MEE1934160.1 hypothetical protein [Pseudomonas sp. 148P]
MLCEYFRYIDLEGVYEQLAAYSSHETYSLSNIQEQFAETLSSVFEDLSYITCEDDAVRDKLKPIELAALVGDTIEEDLDRLAAAANISMPGPRSSTGTVISKLTTLSITSSFGDFDYWQKTSFLAYQYDFLCWLYSKGKFAEGFEVYEMILRNFGEISAKYALNLSFAKQNEIASNIARERAQKRHASTNKKKTELLDEWVRTGAEYKSRADFCRIVSRREGLKERTAQEWIQAYERERR